MSLLVVVAAVTVDLDLELVPCPPPPPEAVELLLLGAATSITELVTTDAEVVAVIIAGGDDVFARIVSSIIDAPIESSVLISTMDEVLPVKEVKSFKSIQLAPIRSQSEIGKLKILVSFSSINWNDWVGSIFTIIGWNDCWEGCGCSSPVIVGVVEVDRSCCNTKFSTLLLLLVLCDCAMKSPPLKSNL